MRQFGVEISGNRRRGCQFSHKAKGAILGQLFAGRSARAVAAEFNTTHSTVLSLKKRFEATNSIEYKPRPGHPSKLTKAEKRYIGVLTDEVNKPVSVDTIRRVVHSYFKRKWKAMKRPKLTAEAARVRLYWAQAWLEDIEELVEVLLLKVGGLVV
ncbi:unnamed protein product [Clonostachys rosea f. rosea IK726]|uniref:Uncharacterized protein n=1 Tax=Clonostachys rosea f. rosea IK726 TaxID=1349383 RepID=A0ACA9ULH0_BIOOC|nr:unnamed protein product [Clonostachys rosea f. rosea IK726]